MSAGESAARAQAAACPWEAIVIGGSSGAIDALNTLLPALPAGLDAAVVVVLHLPRDRRSLLVDIFRERCALTVQEAEDQLWMRPGHLYFAPPDYHLLVDRGPRLALSVGAPVYFSRPSIDVLFESAADCYGEKLLGVLLSGANEDGAAGLAAIHAAGGRTIVQAPASAAMPTMPEAALARQPAHDALTPDEIATLFSQLRTPRLP
ncbi:chemotaxis protein CheB [Achromobacter marplatensis]|jgi:two-component system chemotaxis response regulator CheB|uniref:chemotaxis protein CheB n=1 Tax=Achromobacter marplatensis TaxID=470868 RepID=UPI0028E4136A|nr:chemotaxis protein CheB [Achromobacter marplatensis]